MGEQGYVPGGMVQGRIVHFKPPAGGGYRTDRCLVAMITRVWGPSDTTVQLTVFPDGTNDFDAGGGVGTSLVRWETSVAWDPEGKAPRSWHFPETV